MIITVIFHNHTFFEITELFENYTNLYAPVLNDEKQDRKSPLISTRLLSLSLDQTRRKWVSNFNRTIAAFTVLTQ